MLKVEGDSMTGAAIADDAAILGKVVAVVRPAGSAREASATSIAWELPSATARASTPVVST